MKRKNTKLVKRSEIITQQPETVENPNIAGIKSVIIEHPKTLHKLPKTMKQIEKVFQVSGAGINSDNPLYSETKESEIVLNEKNGRRAKQSHIF